MSHPEWRVAPSRLAPPDRDPNRESFTCWMCGGTSFRVIHAWEVGHPRNPATVPLAIWECLCGLAFLYPQPGAHEMPDQGDWWSEQRTERRRWRHIKELRETIQAKLIGSDLVIFAHRTRRVAPPGAWLDIGCGTGSLLEVARSTHRCEGIEPSPRAARAALERGLTVHEARLEAVELAPGSLEVVTLYGVIEHLENPARALRKTHGWLAPGGVIAVSTPKYRGPSWWIHGRGWNGYRVGYHLFLFTAATLSRAMEAAGFAVLRRPRRSRPLDDILALWGRKVAED